MSGGRPTSYTPELLEKANDYIDNWEQSDIERVPSVEGLAYHIGIARATVYDWQSQEKKQEFSDIVEKVMVLQGMMLQQGGLTGETNASITKLMLTKHGYSDKVETKTDLTVDIKGKSDDELQAIIDGSE